MVREALKIRISIEPDMEICGNAETENEAFEKIGLCEPDLVLVDISLKQGNGISLVKQLLARNSELRILVFSMHAESLYAERAFRAGALGYLNKQESPDQVTYAIRTVLEGRKFFSAAINQRLSNQALGENQESENPVKKLSDRELEVFQLIGQGLTTAEAAKRMGISVHTVDTYRQKIKVKIGVKNGPELQREAVRWVIEQAQDKQD